MRSSSSTRPRGLRTLKQSLVVNNLSRLTSTLGILAALLLASPSGVRAMSAEEKLTLRDEARDMFYHGFNAYMDLAFPADELMPLSCRGRFRGKEPNRGDIDDALGNFSLTLIDSLDTLVMLGDLAEFERGVKLVIENVNFDQDIVVSVFETNIRVLGGLISAHILSEYVRDRYEEMSWYQGELLTMALDIGYRLLPAFNSTTGLPHPRVNLRHGTKAGKIRWIGETCTACAGSMILEFAALSRLTGEAVFEEKASQAMDVLWSSRHRMSNLVGNVLNIHTGDWVRRDSGVGAGIDSYYEYVAKAYVLLGEEKYLGRWQTHYSAVMKYLGQSPLLRDVHMHRPQTNSKHFVDSLGAFWPGLQVLMGDLKPAIEGHEILYQVMQRHNFIPEAFTTDFQVHWGQHFLRPEFLESTYFLYRATHDPHYLEVGKQALRSIQKHARVTCGYATIKDVRTLQKEDRMDSFVLSETFKYLYLLFADDRNDLIIDIDAFVFTTEAHLLPLTLARLSNRTVVPLPEGQSDPPIDEDVEYDRSCPSINFLFPHEEGSRPVSSRNTAEFAQSVRSPLANMVFDKCPRHKVVKRKLLASDFQSADHEHLEIIRDMGISIVALPDGRVQLLHTMANAATPEDGEEGLLFMQEMIELSKQSSELPETPPKQVMFKSPVSLSKGSHSGSVVRLFAGPAQFGKVLQDGYELTAPIVLADPVTACTVKANNGQRFKGRIVVVERGECMFIEKGRNLQSQGAVGGIVLDNVPGTSTAGNPLFAMSGDGNDDITIPMLFLFSVDGKTLLRAMVAKEDLEVTMAEVEAKQVNDDDDDAEEADSVFDFAAPVKSFLDRSRRQMESYFGVEKREHEENPDKIQVSVSSYDNLVATEGSVRGPNDEKVEEVVRLFRRQGRALAVETLTEEEEDRLLASQDEQEDVDDQQSSQSEERPLIEPRRYLGVSQKLSYSHLNPLGAGLGDPASVALLAAPTSDLTKLLVQLMWEDKDLGLEEAFGILLDLVKRYGSKKAVEKVDKAVSDYVEASFSIENGEALVATYQEKIASGDAKWTRDHRLLLLDFLEEASSRVAGHNREETVRSLVVFPAIFDAFETLKEDIDFELSKSDRMDEL